MQVPLEIVRPFARYAEDFDTASSRSRYRTLAASARNETRLEFTERSTDAYKAAMQWVVENCDLLVGVWDGAPSRRRGSTAQAIRHARLIGRRVIHLDVARLAVTRRDTA